jgi:hypothetical protein
VPEHRRLGRRGGLLGAGIVRALADLAAEDANLDAAFDRLVADGQLVEAARLA